MSHDIYARPGKARWEVKAEIHAQQRRMDGTRLATVVSGSMDQVLSAKGETTRLEAACALAILVRETFPSLRLFTFSDGLTEVPAFRGLGLLGAIVQSQQHRNTYLRAALLKSAELTPQAKRVIVVTDEQSQDGNAACWASSGVLVNVASYKPGVDVSQGWTRLNGWSERVVDFIRAEEELSRV